MSASRKARKRQEDIYLESKPKVWKVESDNEDSDLECYDKGDRMPANVDTKKKRIFRKKRKRTDTNFQTIFKKKMSTTVVTQRLGMIVGTVMRVSGSQIGNIIHRSDWGSYQISESEITYVSISRTNPKRTTET